MHSVIPLKLKIKVFRTAGLPAGGELEKVARTGLLEQRTFKAGD